MDQHRVLSVRRTDVSDGSQLLLRVSKDGPDALDLLMLGTEGNGGFFKKVKHDSVSSLRAKAYKGDESEWITALSWALLGSPPDEAHASFVEHLELAASHNQKADKIELHLRQAVSGITQRLGDISLDRDDSYLDSDIDLWQWTILAAGSAREAESRLRQAERTNQEQSRGIEKLKDQLDEFIKVKQKDEEEMLEKFRQLLNSKKLKIRDQQRLLAGAKVDPTAAAKVANARASAGTAPSRRGKRRKLDVKEEKSQSDVLPDEDDDEEEDTDVEGDDGSATMETPEKSADEEEREELPPPKELPVGASRPAPPEPSSSKMDVAEDDVETDDEL